MAPPVFQALKSVFAGKASRECFPADPVWLMGSRRAGKLWSLQEKRMETTILGEDGAVERRQKGGTTLQ